MQRFLILFLLTTACLGAQGQQLDPNDYIYPLRELKQRLYSANFGEIRPGHFHAGVDIKTDAEEGKPVVAAADGYVSRVVLQAGGYGRAVYLTLRNGTTVVYGHLRRFRDDIERHVRRERYERRSNGVNLWFGPGTWPVKQGDVVAYSGDSGSSGGPHLHYEIRDTETQRLYNPVREGIIRPRDEYPPRIVRLHYVEVDTVQGIPVHSRPESYAVVRSAGGNYRLTREEPVGAGRKGYFVVEASDRRNGVGNTFGLWRLALSADGKPLFEYRMDGFEQANSRCCDAVSHYPMQLTSRNEVIRLAQLAESPDCFYPVMRERGLVRTAEGEKRRIRIEAEDDCGNRSQLEFDILGRTETLRAEADSTAVVLRPEKAALVRAGRDLTARIPAGAVYEPIFCRPEQRQAPASDSTAAILSPAYRILGAETPLRRPMTVSVHAFVPDDMQSRTVLATRTAKGRIACIGGRYADGAVTATTRTTGDIFVAADIIPPRIRPLFSEGADLGGARSIRFRVSDNFSGIASCTLLIDGRWVPCDRFPMQGTLVHAFDLPAAKKRRSVQLTVTDRCGNTARWEGTFWR